MNQSRSYWIVGAIAAVGVVLSLVLGGVAGGVAGYYFGRRVARSTTSQELQQVPRLNREPYRIPNQQGTPTPSAPGTRRQAPQAQVAAEITSVVAGGPAEKAGLQVGDLITGINDQQVTLMNDLSQLIRQYKPGDTVTVQLLRNGNQQSAQVTLGSREGLTNVPYLGVEYRTNLQIGEPQSPE
jgi:predicted metalloprotease with PDZ domain